MTNAVSGQTIDVRFERELQFMIRGERKTGTLFVGDLRYDSERRRWGCHWSLSFVHPEIGRLFGDDPLDAFVTTLDFVSSLIRGSEQDGLVVWWRYEGDHAGLTFEQCETKSWLDMPGQKSPKT